MVLLVHATLQWHNMWLTLAEAGPALGGHPIGHTNVNTGPGKCPSGQTPSKPIHHPAPFPPPSQSSAVAGQRPLPHSPLHHHQSSLRHQSSPHPVRFQLHLWVCLCIWSQCGMSCSVCGWELVLLFHSCVPRSLPRSYPGLLHCFSWPASWMAATQSHGHMEEFYITTDGILTNYRSYCAPCLSSNKRYDNECCLCSLLQKWLHEHHLNPYLRWINIRFLLYVHIY